MRYSPWVVSEHVPDLFSLEQMLMHPRFAGKQDQDLAMALWEFMVDRNLGLFHYLPAIDNFTEKDVYDPLATWNSYGFTICHCHANILGMMGQAAGMKTRIADIKGHEGTEFWYDNAWHYYDGDIQLFHRLHPPQQDTVASLEQIASDLSLVDGQENPSNPYGLPDRLPNVMRNLYDVVPHYQPIMAEQMRSMDYVLRPGETMLRFFYQRGRWAYFSSYQRGFKNFCRCREDMPPTETGPEGPQERFWPRRKYGNGYLYYAPCLTDQSQDLALADHEMEGLASNAQGLACTGDAGRICMTFASPYAFAGIPDAAGRLPASEGANLELALTIPAGGSAAVVLRKASGKELALWSSSGETGDIIATVDYTEHVERHFSASIEIRLTGSGTVLTKFANRLWFMVSPHSLPALKNAGVNAMTVHHGDKWQSPTRPIYIDQMIEGPDDVPACLHAAENLRYDPETYARLLPANPAKPWRAVIKVDAPGAVEWLKVFCAIESRKPEAPADDFGAVIEIARNADGPWTQVAHAEVHEHKLGWHFAVFGEGKLDNDNGSEAYVRISSKMGMKYFRITAHYRPNDAVAVAGPAMEVEHAWFEDDPREGLRLKKHLEIVEEAEHAYTVNCGAEPRDEWIRMAIPSTGPARIN